ncbi:MAG: FAD-dependent oxidoreductase [Acidobacteria bacterium]|nr:FAD-dependent oxidoreductase [Acidobacteriota bacterium]
MARRGADCDVAIIGAGVARLSAAAVLSGAGIRVVCLEACGRIGGRILTQRDPLCPVPIELGAEFVHGRIPALPDLCAEERLTLFEDSAKALYFQRGKIHGEELAMNAADELMARFAAKDRALPEAVSESRQPAVLKKKAVRQLEGFNAARANRISVKALKADATAAEKIEGNRAFRVLNGYSAVPLALWSKIPDARECVRLGQAVERVEWAPGDVRPSVRSMVDGGESTLRAKRVIVTVSLGVLREEAITFDPKPAVLG